MIGTTQSYLTIVVASMKILFIIHSFAYLAMRTWQFCKGGEAPGLSVFPNEAMGTLTILMFWSWKSNGNKMMRRGGASF